MPLIIPSNSISGEFEVANSLRFDDGSSDSLNRTNTSSGSRKVFTFSCWFKKSTLGSASDDQMIFSSWDGSNGIFIQIDASDLLQIYSKVGGVVKLNVRSEMVFRDTSAWYHLVVKFDSNITNLDLYVNGEEISQTVVVAFVDADHEINESGGTHYIGTKPSDRLWDGYMAEVVFIDGTALDPTSFGEFDEDTGIWKPINVSGLTFGTNGFYLDFENSGSLGNDKSGNGNNFTVNNLTSIDQTTDTPTLNYATLNAVLPSHSSTFSEGNCKWTPSTASEYYWSNSNFGLSQGKWYMEAKLTTASGHNYFGISIDQPDDSTTFLAGGGGIGGANDLYEWGWKSSDGKIYNNTDGGTAYGNTYTTGDILGLYLDLDNNKLYFAKNGTIQNSGTGISITDPASTPNGVYFIAVGDGDAGSSSVWEANFGNPTFSISSSNSDPNGYGNFEYSPNDGGSASFDSSAKDFYALNTKNLAEYG